MGNRFQHFKDSCVAVFWAGVRVAYVCLWLGMIGGTIYGLNWCRDRVLAMPQYRKSATVRLEQLPSWLNNPDHEFIRQQIINAVKLDPQKDCFADDAVTAKVARGLTECKWVEQVLSVRKDERDGIIWVKCRYSLPTAWIQQNDKCYLIDERGYRLPVKYPADRVAGNRMPVISGVAESPPEVGQPWLGDDLQAGLKEARILPARIRQQVAAIDVENYTGRKDPQAPDIKLITQERASEIFWGHAPGEEYDVELTADYKIKVLEDNLRHCGRIDGDKAYLDIRTAPAFQPAPRLTSGTSNTKAIARADRR